MSKKSKIADLQNQVADLIAGQARITNTLHDLALQHATLQKQLSDTLTPFQKESELAKCPICPGIMTPYIGGAYTCSNINCPTRTTSVCVVTTKLSGKMR